MRRRRRQTTQTLRKKSYQSPPQSQFPSATTAPGKWRRVFLYLIFAVVLVWGTYYLYQKNFQTTDITGITRDTLSNQTAADIQDQTEAPFEQNVQIEILNGCGVTGIAKVFQSYLRQNGFDVVNTENYIEDGQIRWDLPESMIIDHGADPEQAREVARILHLSSKKIVFKDDPAAIYDISVVLGKDYKKLLGAE